MLKVDGSKISNSSRSFASNVRLNEQKVNRQLPNSNSKSNVSFQGGGSEFSKRGWFALKQLSNKMKDASEITNAFIAAIGTGIIAPMIILVSPGKGDKEDNDKKFFQAIRQPLSAGLALAFQLPATMAVNKFINNLAYEKKIKLFKDDILGDLIPDNKYLRGRVTQAEIDEISKDFEKVENGKSYKSELEGKIREQYEESGMKISDEKLARRVEKDKKNFLIDKIVDSKRNGLIDERVELFKRNNFDISKIKDADLVTEDDKLFAIHKNNGYKSLEGKYNLSLFDKMARLMGLSTKKVAELEEEQKQAAINDTVEKLKNECSDIFENPDKKLRKYIETLNDKSKKTFAAKKFWLQLLVNLFMVTASCYALNWTHPRFKEFIDKHKKGNSNEQPQTVEAKKVEVEA